MRSDIFSFGAVLYEMVTGRRAFRGDSELATLSAIMRDEPKPVIQIIPHLSQDLDKIISRCLRKDSARRFQTMADLKIALEDLQEDVRSGAVEPVAAMRQPPRRAVTWAAGIVLLAAGGLIGWLVLPPKRVPASVTAVPLTTYPEKRETGDLFAGWKPGRFCLGRRETGQLRHLRQVDRRRVCSALDYRPGGRF